MHANKKHIIGMIISLFLFIVLISVLVQYEFLIMQDEHPKWCPKSFSMVF